MLAALAGCGGGGDGSSATTTSGTGAFDADRAFADLTAQVDLGPRATGSKANADDVEQLARKLEEAGVQGVRVQSPLQNVVGVIPGSEPGYVVVGAHHDTVDVPGFVGANDGASGVAVVLELARDLPNPLPGPSIAIALFDGEEARGNRDFSVDGKRGSTQYVDLAERAAQGSPPLDEIKAMVLFDMVGDCDLHIPLEPGSDLDLYDRFARADPGVFSGRTFPIDDDHTPFLEHGIPAVDLIDFDYGPGRAPGAFWHTTEDTVDHVCPASLEAVGEAALEVIPQIR
jgi:glutaminyl-peptide cyclotransferase